MPVYVQLQGIRVEIAIGEVRERLLHLFLGVKFDFLRTLPIPNHDVPVPVQAQAVSLPGDAKTAVEQ